MSTMNSSNLLCIRFDFGLPLEDIFPPDDIHPRLHNLFYETILAFKDYGDIPFRYILENYEVCLNEAFEVKTKLIDGKLHYKENMSPSSFIWLIRHFLGLLPLQLFPHFTDNKIYKWECLATKCRIWNINRNDQLISEISWWIHKLPKANIMLIYNLVDFLRKICQSIKHPGRLDWRNVKAATIYFSSSVFFRPYRPGTVTTTDDLYYPLLAFIIVKWRKIRKFKNYHTIVNNQLFCISENKEPISLVDIDCQTSRFYLKPEADDKSIETDSKNVSKYSQTENETSEKVDQKSEVHIENQNEEKSSTKSSVPTYEEILDNQLSDVKTNDQTTIYKKTLKQSTKILTPKVFLKKKLSKANLSLVDAISKIKSKQELFKTRSSSKIDTKYKLLEKHQNEEKVQSTLVNNHCGKKSNIKYKKLMTL